MKARPKPYRPRKGHYVQDGNGAYSTVIKVFRDGTIQTAFGIGGIIGGISDANLLTYDPVEAKTLKRVERT